MYSVEVCVRDCIQTWMLYKIHYLSRYGVVDKPLAL